MKPQLKQADPAAIAHFKQQVRLQPNRGSDDCWVLVRTAFIFRGCRYGGHRAAWMLKYGRIPIGMYVSRRCCNRECVRPSHMFMATPKEAIGGDRHWMRLHPERVARGDRSFSRLHPERLARGDRNGSRLHPERVPRGEGQHKAKLTSGQVLYIRKAYAQGKSLKVLARQHGVTTWCVNYVVRKINWKHLP